MSAERREQQERAYSNLEAERSVLGTILVHNAALVEVMPILAPPDFYWSPHVSIFDAMVALDGRSQPIDLVTLRAALDARGELEAVGGPAYIASLATGTPRAVNVRFYADLVKERAILRGLRAAAQKTIATVEAQDATWTEIAETLERDLYALTSRAAPAEWISGRELARRLRDDVETRITHRGQPRGLPYGFVKLDEITDGLQADDLVILAGRPSMGKSALQTAICAHAARSVNVAVFSIEMAHLMYGLRDVIADAQVDGWRLMTGTVSTREQLAVAESLQRLEASGLYIDDCPNRSPLEIRSRLRELQARVGPLGLVAIDYLQLMQPLPEHRRETKTNQVAGISRALKVCAREFHVPFLVLSQLNRRVDQSADKRPQLSDLRDSGALEQDADVVLLVHRPAYYATTDEERAKTDGLAEVIVAKQRNGATGLVKLAWLKEQMRFATLSADGPTLVRR